MGKPVSYLFMAPPELEESMVDLESFVEWPFRDQVWKILREGGMFVVTLNLEKRKTRSGLTRYYWRGMVSPVTTVNPERPGGLSKILDWIKRSLK